MNNLKIYFDKDINTELIKTKKIAIVGFGSQGYGQSMNLRDSGCDVILGLRQGGASDIKAKDYGFKTMSIKDAVKEADIIQILMVSCTALDSYYSEEYGGSLFDLEPDVFDGDIALDAKAVARLRSGAAADGLPYIDPTFEYDGFAINTGKRTYTIWGSINSCIKPKEVGGSGETLYQTTFTDSDISLIIDVNGQRFSFVSDDLDMDVDSVEGTAMINGSICYIEFLLSVDSTPVYPDIIPPDPVVEQLSSIDFSA